MQPLLVLRPFRETFRGTLSRTSACCIAHFTLDANVSTCICHSTKAVFFSHAVSLPDAALGLQSACSKGLPLKFVMWRRCEIVVIRDFVPLFVLMHVLLKVHSVLCPRLPAPCLASIVEVFSVVWYRMGFIFCECESIQRSVVPVLLACWLSDCRRNALWTKQLLPTVKKKHGNMVSCNISVLTVSTTRQIHSAFSQIVSLTHEQSTSTSVICVLLHGNFTAPVVENELMASAGLLTKNVSSLECSTLHVLDLLCGLNHSSFGRTCVCHVGFRCSILAIQRPWLHWWVLPQRHLRCHQVVAPVLPHLF